MQHFILIITILISSLGFTQLPKSQDIVINISNFNNNDGKAFIGLYDSEANWLIKRVKGTIIKIENNKCTVTLKDIEPGIYAVSIFHDENSNNKLDSNFLGIPKEDTGSSNNAPARFGPPKWKDAKFEVKNETIIQNIKL